MIIDPSIVSLITNSGGFVIAYMLINKLGVKFDKLSDTIRESMQRK